MGGVLATCTDDTGVRAFADPAESSRPQLQQHWVSYTTVDALYRQELEKTPEKIRAYQLKSVYDGKWRSAYNPWVEQFASFNRSPEYPRMAWNQALRVSYDFHSTRPSRIRRVADAQY